VQKISRQGKYKNKVKHYRENIGITQEELAEKLKSRGLKASGAYISQIEAGLKNIPYGLAVAICQELGFHANRVTDIFLPDNFTGSLDATGTEGT